MRKRESSRMKIQELDMRCTALLEERCELRLELDALKQEWGHVREQDQEIRRLHESVRRLKHDMKNHLLVIASCLNAGDYDAAREYASGMLDKLNSIHSYVETGNSLLDHKAGAGAEQGHSGESGDPDIFLCENGQPGFLRAFVKSAG